MRVIFTLLMLLGLAGHGSSARATSLDLSPRPCAILRNSDGLIALSSPTTATLYSLRGIPITTFELGDWIAAIEVSVDERFLALGGYEGSVALFAIAGATRLARISITDSACSNYISDMSFSVDGELLVVASGAGTVVVHRTADGMEVHREKLEDAYSAAVANDLRSIVVSPPLALISVRAPGTNGSRIATDGGVWPVRFVKADELALCRSDNLGHGESLRVINSQSGRHLADLGPLGYIQRIRPLDDGSALITASVGSGGRSFDDRGYRFDPSTLKVTEVWRFADPTGHGTAMDFDQRRNLGVTTDYQLRTRLVNLPDGSIIRTIDNSHRLGEGHKRSGTMVFGGLFLLVSSLAITVWRLRAARDRAVSECG